MPTECCHRLDRDRDRGQAVVLMLPIIAIATMVALAAVRAGDVAADRARAQAAADAAAIAGVTGGSSSAARMARVNGATLTRFVVLAGSPGGAAVSVQVSVAVGGVAASARATNGP